MRKVFLGLGIFGLAFLMILPSLAKKDEGARIKDGVIEYSAGHYLAGTPLPLGYDVYGYNYQAHMFRGSYANAYLGRPGAAYPPYNGDDDAYLAENPGVADHWVWPYRNEVLEMKWNDQWLSNMDRDGDGVLDRYNGFPSYSGSHAWLTNHQWGEENPYFVKIVAAPADASQEDGVWYTAGGQEIGPVIWGAFAIIQEQGGGLDRYVSPSGPGFGKY